jgi:hypothetical protein
MKLSDMESSLAWSRICYGVQGPMGRNFSIFQPSRLHPRYRRTINKDKTFPKRRDPPPRLLVEICDSESELVWYRAQNRVHGPRITTFRVFDAATSIQDMLDNTLGQDISQKARSATASARGNIRLGIVVGVAPHLERRAQAHGSQIFEFLTQPPPSKICCAIQDDKAIPKRSDPLARLLMKKSDLESSLT